MSPSHQLIRAVRESRIDISREYSALLSDLDIRKKFLNSFRSHPLRWIGGAASAGILTSFLVATRSKKATKTSHSTSTHPGISGNTSYSKAGWLAGAIEAGKLLYPVLRPLLLEFATNTVRGRLAKKSGLR